MARRNSQGFCDGCGLGWTLRTVRVEPVRPTVPDVGQLVLCAMCLEKPVRTWRLRYRLAV